MNNDHGAAEHIHDENCATAMLFAESIAGVLAGYVLHGYSSRDALLSLVIMAMQAVEESPEWWQALRSRLAEPGTEPDLSKAARIFIHATPIAFENPPQ